MIARIISLIAAFVLMGMALWNHNATVFILCALSVMHMVRMWYLEIKIKEYRRIIKRQQFIINETSLKDLHKHFERQKHETKTDSI